MLPSHHHQAILKSKNDYKIPTLYSFPSPPASPRQLSALQVRTIEKPGVSGYMGKKETKSKSYVEQYRIQALIRQGKAKKFPVKNYATSTSRVWNQNPAAKLPRRAIEVSDPIKLKPRIHKTIKRNSTVETYRSKSRVQVKGNIILQDDILSTHAPALVKSKCDLSTTVLQVATRPSHSEDCSKNDIPELPEKQDLLSNNSTAISHNNETITRNSVNDVTSESSNVIENDPEKQAACCQLCATQTNQIRSTTSLQRNNLTMEVTLVLDSSLSKSNPANTDIPQVQKINSATLHPLLESVTIASSHLQKSDATPEISPEKEVKDRSDIKATDVQQMQIRVAKSFTVSTNQVLEIVPIPITQFNVTEPVKKDSMPLIPTAEEPSLSRNLQDPNNENTEMPRIDNKEEQEQEIAVEPVVDSTKKQSSIQVLSEPHDFGPSVSKDLVTPYLASRKSAPRSDKVSKYPQKSSGNNLTVAAERRSLNKTPKLGCEDCRLRKGALSPASLSETNRKTSVKSNTKNKPIPAPPSTPPRRRLIFRKSPSIEKPERIIGPLNKVSEEIDKMAPAFSRSSVFEIPSRENVQWQKSQEGYLSFSSIVLLYKVDQRMAGILRLTNHSSQGVFFRVSSSCDFPDRYTLEPKEGKVGPYKRVLIKIITETVLEEVEFRDDIFKIETVTYNETITYTTCRRFWMNVDPSKILSTFTSCILLYHPRDAFFRACLLHSKSKLRQFVDLKKGTGLTVTLKEILQDIEIAQKELDTIRRMELVNLAISICIALLSFMAAWYHLT
ncbi:unnamed protein product [Allacma fusca]|uniref:MSP domain-containing protein n=1 Tax=Allacma fusca TaxID=39272 RepID=A0A8J2KZI6_9HEXA|nr:unnamed protein product [Allacma fusca]